jgi:transketolase
VAPVHDKWKSFGWRVLEADGHSVADLVSKLSRAAKIAEKAPVLVIARTIKGKGVSFMEGQAAWHGSCPDGEQMNQALKELEENFAAVPQGSHVHGE